MTRQEEISKKAKEMYHDGATYFLQFRAGFCTGARWADEHPRKGLVDIEKYSIFAKNRTCQRLWSRP